MTNGICRSLWRVRLETYHGAMVIKRRALDWNLWIIFVFDGSLQPHRCIPYVHKDFIMHLYSRSLFSMDNLDLRPKSQGISRSLSFWRFVLTCFCYVNFWPRYNPEYFASVWTGICMLLMLTCGQFIRLVVNVTCTDFVWFILIFLCCTIAVGGLGDVGDVVMLLLDHYVLLARLCRPRSLRLWCCLLLACLQYKLDIVEAPTHFLVVRLISLDSNLNMNYYILFENVFQWFMALIVDIMGWGMYFLFCIIVQCVNHGQTPELRQGKQLHHALRSSADVW
jgi:hypothetical protein